MSRFMTAEYFKKFSDRFCESSEIRDLGVELLTTKIDRYELGQQCPSGPDEAGMAMWSEPFDGGVWLAGYIKSHPSEFKGKKLVDVGTGAGIVAIAAAQVGALVTAIDSSPMACGAVEANALLNNVSINIICADAGEVSLAHKNIFEEAEIVTAADIFYAHRTRDKLISFLADLADANKTVLVSSHDENVVGFFESGATKSEALWAHNHRAVKLVARPKSANQVLSGTTAGAFTPVLRQVVTRSTADNPNAQTALNCLVVSSVRAVARMEPADQASMISVEHRAVSSMWAIEPSPCRDDVEVFGKGALLPVRKRAAQADQRALYSAMTLRRAMLLKNGPR